MGEKRKFIQPFYGSMPQSSFVANHYVVFRDGLPYYSVAQNSDGTQKRDAEGNFVYEQIKRPNALAIQQAQTKGRKLIDTTLAEYGGGKRASSNELTTLSYLYNLISDIAKAERKKEMEFIKNEMKKFEKASADGKVNKEEVSAYKELAEIYKHLYHSTPEQGGYDATTSSAFSILLRHVDYRKLKEELKSPKNKKGLQGDSSTYTLGGVSTEFYAEIQKMLEEDADKYLELESTDDGEKIVTTKELKNKLAKILQTYLRSQRKLITNNVELASLYGEALHKFEEYGFLNPNNKVREKLSNNLFRFIKNEEERQNAIKVFETTYKNAPSAKLIEFKGAKGGRRKLRTVLREALNNLLLSTWEAGEKVNVVASVNLGGSFAHTGDLLSKYTSYTGKTYNRNSVDDSIIVSLGSSEQTEELSKLFDQIRSDSANRVKSNNSASQEDLDKMLPLADQMLETARKYIELQEDIGYILHINTKMYKSGTFTSDMSDGSERVSKDDRMHVVNKRSFDSLFGKPKQIIDSFNEARGRITGNRGNYRVGRLTGVFNSLLFELANTVEGAVFDSSEDKEKIKTAIGLITVLWMYNDFEEQVINMGINKRKMDNELHIFQSGSAYITLSDLLGMTLKELKEKMKDAKRIQFASVTLGLSKTNYNSMHLDLQKEYPTSYDNDPATNQEILSKRWQAIRNDVLKNSTMDIRIRQRHLDLLLGRLSKQLNP